MSRKPIPVQIGTEMVTPESRSPRIDAVLDVVQINAENQILRRNRLTLLHRIRAPCLQAADLMRIGG